MKTTNHSEIIRNMDQQALRTYGALAFVVYSFALAYCYYTEHFFEMKIVGAVMLGLGILIVKVYSSLGLKSQANEHETKHSFRYAG